MGKGTNFIGQPLLTQLLKYFDKDKILRMSRKCGGELRIPAIAVHQFR